MTTRSCYRHILLSGGLALLLGACSGASTPASNAPTAPGARPPVVTAPPAPAATSAAGNPTGEPPAGADTGAACTIVTKDDVAKAAGFAINAVSGVDTVCYFQNADLSKYLIIKLYENQADMALPLEMESGSRHIAGLGDDAFWVPVAGILFVRQGDHAIQISDSEGALTAERDQSLQDGLVTLARTALPKL